MCYFFNENWDSEYLNNVYSNNAKEMRKFNVIEHDNVI